ncbi:PREDICTED: uncharacterized protein LOC104746305 [Camelina sativa]|uniref:Uncharacterized protein LOC104746305 n=1 Tax=Camelina sativa TaxID=90675 RepID=A0ABM1R116_CAMSA|nr:PREDICTED: uncharacterized protein LOC104746305 [Camelina sativa]XP_019092704.1 PREDICTED: uncharacterized protein LOC104746305 [Camelina sativa]
MANAVEQSSLYSSSFVDARISFSNDFADGTNHSRSQLQETISRAHDQMKYKEAPVSSDFKFNVENLGFTSAADEIFFGGVLLPLEKTTQRKVTTLREELSAQDSERTISKGSRNWWKLGLNKSKKVHSNNINFHLPHKSQNCLASILESDD